MYSMNNIDIKHTKLTVKDLSNSQEENFITFHKILNLENNYQKTSIFSLADKRCFIEKFLLNLPIPEINIYTDNDNYYEILKGWEFLLIIYDFFRNKFVLDNMKFFPELNGKGFSDLTGKFKRQFMERDISFNILHNNSLADKNSLKIVKELMR